MNSAMAKFLLSVGLVVVAGAGFFANRHDSSLELFVPRVVRDMERCVSSGDMEDLAIIIRDRPDLVNLSMFGGPPLHVAARSNQPLVIDFLLKHDADRYARGGADGLERCTALHWACLWGSKEVVEVMLQHGFDVENRENILGTTPLYWAAFGSWEAPRPSDARDYEGLVRMLIDHGASVDTYDSRGRSAASVASDSVARILREYRAKPGEKSAAQAY